MQTSVSQDRHKYLGGSDIPIIMGISPFKTRFELLQEKAQIKENDFEGNQYTEYGNILEPKIRNYINETYGREFKEGKHIKGDIRIHSDGEDIDTILEIKTTSIIHDTLEEYQVYLVQTLFYMMNTKKSNGKLCVYERPKDFNEEFEPERLHIYDFTLEDFKELCERINFEVDLFREDLEKLKTNPFLTEEELLPNELIEVSNKLVMFELKLEEMKAIELQAKEMKTQLKALMEEYGKDKWITPKGIKITLVKDTPNKEIEEEYVNEDLFIRENEKLYKKYNTKRAEYLETRTITKKGKSGYVRVTIPKA